MQSMRQLGDELAHTALSTWLNEHSWVVPISQSIHILCIGIVLGSTVVIATRLLAPRRPGRSLSQWVLALTPWMHRALAGLLLTGLVQVITEPVRQFVTPHFWWKMGLVALAAATFAVFARSVRERPAAWDDPTARPGLARAYAFGSLAAWITLIVLGRFIGYVWLDYA